MTPYRPDTQVQREIREFNHEFLNLICAHDQSDDAYGLTGSLCQRLRTLTPPQLDVIASMPCLLAGFIGLSQWEPRRSANLRARPQSLFTLRPDTTDSAPLTTQQQLRVAEQDRPRSRNPVASEAAPLYAASLLAWLWHTARQDPLLAALCVGPGTLAVEQISAKSFRELKWIATSAAGCLEARFCRHPRLWPDLIRAASTEDAQVLTATRLSIVQLTLLTRH
ncbi:MAG: hypothetical protein R3F24_00020 [Gammaproteobacteria bacterium]